MNSVIRFEDNPVTSLCIYDNFAVFWPGCSVRGVGGTCNCVAVPLSLPTTRKGNYTLAHTA